MDLLTMNYYLDPIVKLLHADWLASITIWSIIIRVLLSIVLGGLVGVERAVKRHAAGLRTFMLVSLGACVAMMTNQFIVDFYGSGDASRIGAQVISGIGFLGAGTIMISSRSRIKGLTTAAGLWACASVGIALGAGFYTLAIIGCFVITLVLTFLPRLEYYIRDHGKFIEYQIEFNDKYAAHNFIEAARKEKMIVQSVEANPSFSSDTVFSYSFILEKAKDDKRCHKKVLDFYSKLPYIIFIEEIF